MGAAVPGSNRHGSLHTVRLRERPGAHPGMPLDTPGYRLWCQVRGRSLTRWPGGTQAATPTQHLSFPLEGLVLTGDSQPFQIHNSPFI